MSMRTLETAITAAAREFLNYPGLRLKDVLEWSSGELKPHDGEIAFYLPDPGVFVCVKKKCDKRKVEK
jgi:hypothetical protein